MDFMVHIINKFPPDADPDLLSRLTSAETERAKELADQGILLMLWRRTGQRANVGIWSASDATILHSALASLPFYPWLEIEIWPLTEHPNNPAIQRGKS